MSTKAAAMAALTGSTMKQNRVAKPMAPSKATKITKRPATMAEGPASNGKTHKRSRSGCFTCRLRRKKCDEVKPGCKACRHLGLLCEYKRPTWWNDNNLRKAQKELIKTLIKKTKTIEKQASKEAAANDRHTPPGLSRSVPTSATSPGSCTRAVSEDSQYSDYEQFDGYHPQIMSQYPYTHDPSTQAHYYGYPTFPTALPYEVDIKTERQTYINDVPTRRDSTISTFSTYHPPHSTMAPLLEQDWMPEDIYEEGEDMFSDYPAAAQEYVDFPQAPPAPTTTETSINVDLDECDKPLLEHFFEYVLPLIFPVMDVNETGPTGSQIIIQALESNKTYLSSCLSTAAVHMSSMTGPSEQLDSDIVRHRYATISQLCEQLGQDIEHDKILEATLAMITLPCTVGRADDNHPDIPWHKHFEAAKSLIDRLQLPSILTEVKPENPGLAPPFNMSVAAWIDILGATMLGQAPKFADIYRDKHLNASSSGLAELMGCDDRIMYLISELSCLASLQNNGAISEDQLCAHITGLGQQIELHENSMPRLYDSVMSENGAIQPAVLQRNITLIFSKAARIFLLSLLPGITRHDPTMCNLLNEFTHLLTQVPAGPSGFDRSIVWPLLIAGAHSTRSSIFRTSFAERLNFLGDSKLRENGSFGRMARLLQEVWANNDAVDAIVEAGSGTPPGEESMLSAQIPQQRDVHWRDVMMAKGWDFLLI